MRFALLVLVVCVARGASADEVDDLVANGEALAKKGEFTSAIDAFKQADAKRPRAAHACLIGLVYTRRELWPQAELFFARCHARATAEDPLPSWLANAERQLAQKLVADGAAPITIQVTPPAAKITISSFAPDESFEPQTIHLAPGHHTIEATADGYAPVSREVIVESAAPQTIAIDLTKPDVATPPAPPPVVTPAPVQPTPPPPAPPRSKLPLVVLGGGIALGAIGGAVDLFVEKPARDRLAAAQTTALYNARLDSFRLRRDVTVGLYAGALAAVAVGVVLYFTYDRHEVSIGATPVAGGGAVRLGWSL
jgi:hypothetical protein